MSKLTTPTPWQERVLAIPEDLNIAMLGGRGSGKTTALALRLARPPKGSRWRLRSALT